MRIVSDCPICEQHSLHVTNENNIELMQCVNCGFATADKFKGTVDTNEAYKELTEQMQNWSLEINGRIWIPSLLTLPEGMLYPIDDNEGNMKWAYAKMIDIPEDEQKNYPNSDGGYYQKRYDTENAKIYDMFIECFAELNSKMQETRVQPIEITLPKLKKV